MSTHRTDIYTRVTDHIIGELEKGVCPWVQPWTARHAAGEVSRPQRFNGIPYQGINILLLWMSALSRHFVNPLWMTYRQASELGGQVRHGEKGSMVVYADTFKRREADESGEEHEVEIPFLKSYVVFNSEQIDSLPDHYYAQIKPAVHATQRIEGAERFFADTGADIRHGGGMAYYVPSDDFVQMPPFETFRDAQGYYATLSHELTHNAAHRIMPRAFPFLR